MNIESSIRWEFRTSRRLSTTIGDRSVAVGDKSKPIGDKWEAVGDDRRLSATIGDRQTEQERKRSKKKKHLFQLIHIYVIQSANEMPYHLT